MSDCANCGCPTVVIDGQRTHAANHPYPCRRLRREKTLPAKPTIEWEQMADEERSAYGRGPLTALLVAPKCAHFSHGVVTLCEAEIERRRSENVKGDQHGDSRNR